MPMASVARSGRPILVTISEISANSASSFCSTRVEMSTDSSSDTDGSFRVSMRMDPSSSRGMNSVPRKGMDPTAVRMMTVATPTVAAFRAMATRSTDRYRSRRRTNHDASRWTPPNFSRKEETTGTPVSERRSDPKSAEQTVMAIGRNIFPSRPSRVRIGR